MYRKFSNGPMWGGITKQKISYKGCENYINIFGPLLYFDAKQLFHNIPIKKITYVYYQGN